MLQCLKDVILRSIRITFLPLQTMPPNQLRLQIESNDRKIKAEPTNQVKFESKGVKRGFNEIADSTIKTEQDINC